MNYFCRCCEQELPRDPILIFENMPRGAQRFLEVQELEQDKGITIEVSSCDYCGLIQIPGNPVSYYKNVIRATGVSEEMCKFRFKQFSDFIEKYSLYGKKIIEIGSGCGEYMSIMSNFEVTLRGLEYCFESVSKSKQKNLDVVQGYIENSQYKIEEAPYEAFYMLNFLEHIPEPNQLLRGLYNNLEDEAIGLIEVPNVDMILETALFSEFISDHLMYFTSATFQFILQKNGFEILSCEPIWYNYILSMVVKKRKRIDVTNFKTNREQLSKVLNLYLDKFDKEEVAIWGAGHQALAVISLTGIQNKVNCIIDSAGFKQNKFTSATHIPVMSPEILKQGNLKTVIVMAAAYSDEIVDLISKVSSNVQIAVLRGNRLELF